MARAMRYVAGETPDDGEGAVLVIDPPRSGTAIGTFFALLAFVPVWIPRPLMIGDFSFAFMVPVALALWALTQPARPGAIARALRGSGGVRGLWLEALCAIAILMLAAVSMLTSPEPWRAFRVIIPMSYALWTMLLLARAPPDLQQRLVRAALYSGALVLGLALLLTQSGSGRLLVMRDYRFLAFFENPNQLGVIFLAVWPLSIALLLNAATARARLGHLAVVLILASAILISGTKTALAFGFLSGALTWLYHGSRTGNVGAMVGKLIIILCAIVVAVPLTLWILSWASPAFYARVTTILDNGVWAFPSMQTRGEIWKESIQSGLDHPLLGVGAGTGVYGYSHSHNMLLDYFRGMGIFALVAAAALLLSVVARGASFIRSTWRKGQWDRRSDTMVAGMHIGAIFYLAGNLLSDSFSPTTSFLFWMMCIGAYQATAPRALLARRPAPRPSTLNWMPRPQRGASPGGVAQPV